MARESLPGAMRHAQNNSTPISSNLDGRRALSALAAPRKASTAVVHTGRTRSELGRVEQEEDEEEDEEEGARPNQPGPGQEPRLPCLSRRPWA
ncbi:hypothetical protein CKAH01_06983 [Colletotrichum kahawae]|uniref:Uncharacterized protein n=1 Tax=Colletotrichum kahawae TaxID=34407 RepID=A0AAE0D1M6_COLKA|nr:hypothetical protein CKAH01_06983 [Colletotrichum kahawae]